MKLIEQQPHFWELYQDTVDYYLSIAVDMGSVVSCWDLVLLKQDVLAYQDRGRESINDLAQQIIAAAYTGDFSIMHSRAVSSSIKDKLQATYQTWRISQT